MDELLILKMILSGCTASVLLGGPTRDRDDIDEKVRNRRRTYKPSDGAPIGILIIGESPM